MRSLPRQDKHNQTTGFLSRRSLLSQLGTLSLGWSLLPTGGLDDSIFVHVKTRLDEIEGQSRPRGFPLSSSRRHLLDWLCDQIIPPDAEHPGATMVGVPDFIAALAAQSASYHHLISKGFDAVNEGPTSSLGGTFERLNLEEKIRWLGVISHSKHKRGDSLLDRQVEFFAFLRQMTVGLYFTSKEGMLYLGYVGNTYLHEFPGCV